MTKTIYPATLLCDFYKISHREQYPKGTEVVYSTWTPRNSLIEGVNEVVAFGIRGFIQKYLIEYFDEHFFTKDWASIEKEYVDVIKNCLGVAEPDMAHIKDLYNLGHLPIEIKSVDEGTLVPIGTPMLTIENTSPKFFWLTNYLETLMSWLWQPITSATIAYEYRKILDKYAAETSSCPEMVDWQAHDFSMRGMSSLESAAMSGAGHLLSFKGTDSIPAICYLKEYYNANLSDGFAGSVPATEHSVMCTHGKDEYESYRYLIEDIYPTGIVSIVSDTWDLWHVVESVLPSLKNKIMSRDGKLVIRPDSGDPVKIICGNPDSDREIVRKGLIESLYDLFGGTINNKGYKELDSHIGALYGDSITLKRAKEICEKLKAKGFASTNIVLGVGSFTYQYNTRDTFGFALKSTYAKVNGEEKKIYKDPATDTKKIKKSQTGKVILYKDENNRIKYRDGLLAMKEKNTVNNLLRTIYKNSEQRTTIYNTFNVIKSTLEEERNKIYE